MEWYQDIRLELLLRCNLTVLLKMKSVNKSFMDGVEDKIYKERFEGLKKFGADNLNKVFKGYKLFIDRIIQCDNDLLDDAYEWMGKRLKRIIYDEIYDDQGIPTYYFYIDLRLVTRKVIFPKGENKKYIELENERITYYSQNELIDWFTDFFEYKLKDYPEDTLFDHVLIESIFR